MRRIIREDTHQGNPEVVLLLEIRHHAARVGLGARDRIRANGLEQSLELDRLVAVEKLSQVLDLSMYRRIIVEVLPHIGLMLDEGEVRTLDGPANEGAGVLEGIDADDVRGRIEAGDGPCNGLAGPVMALVRRNMDQQEPSSRHV